MSLAHQFLLHHVLNVLDVNKGLVATADALGDGLGDVDGGLGVFLDREESFSDSDLDLRFRPWHDIAIAADQADGKCVRAGADIDVAGFLKGAAESQRFRNIVGFIFEQGFLDEEIEIGLGKAQAAALFEGFREGDGDVVCDLGDEVAVDVGEDGFLILGAGDEEVGKGIADSICDIFKRELGLLVAAGDYDVGVRRALFYRDSAAPVVRADGGSEFEAVGDDLLEDVVFGEI